MLFAVHSDDGQIVQANKVYNPEGYDRLLDQHGLNYVAVQTEGILSPEEWFVNVGTKEIAERPALPIQISKTMIKAGGADSALLTQIPAQARVVVYAAGAELHRLAKLDATELEISIPVPCRYTVVIDLWPYKTSRFEIEAI